jgi:pSer/pThr/pTyr-binding forkhead associated (FHA) protein
MMWLFQLWRVCQPGPMTEPRNTDTHKVEIYGTAGSPPDADTSPPQPLPDEVRLEISTSGGRQSLRLTFSSAQLLVGRGENDNSVEIDLTPHGALDNGVSRRHAALLRRSDGIYIEDLASTNGTRINGFTLRPNKTYRLRHGDEIEFGRLRTVIRFIN